MRVSSTTIVVRYVETDQMGIAHHSNYFPWFEVGRTEFIKELGMSYTDMESKGVLLPLVEAGCKYKAPAKYEDVLIIRTCIEELDPVKIKFKYEAVRKADSKLLAEGFTLHAFVARTMRPINLRKKMPEIWEIMLAGLE
jgi:acyl-CoA thioester hydrolase